MVESRSKQGLRWWVYGLAMAGLALAAFLITLLLTQSVWWALLALFAAGPVAQALLLSIGLRPQVVHHEDRTPGPDPRQLIRR